MDKICTTSKQSEQLLEAGIPIETADLWVTSKIGSYVISTERKSNSKPAWSLSKLIAMIKPYPSAHVSMTGSDDFFEDVFQAVLKRSKTIIADIDKD